jgi:proton-dependent oligopeptide transporter, POT family
MPERHRETPDHERTPPAAGMQEPSAAAALPPADDASRQTHPRGLWVLFITEMWERFSYYGMRALLVLYLIASTSETLKDGGANENPGFGWSKDDASILYGIYTGAVYLTPLLGGWLADKFLGTHRSMLIGGWIIAAGHLTLAATEFFGITAGEAVTLQTGPGALVCFLAGLVLIVIGTGFFKPCVSVMVGQLYGEGDPRRDSGFTIFYMGINLGAFFSPLVAGTLGETVGWHWGFGSAAVGMIAGLTFYQIFRPKYLAGIGLPPGRRHDDRSSGPAGEQSDAGPESTAPRHLTSIEWQRLAVIVILAFVGNIVFWAAFEQAGSSMNIFAKEETDRTLGGMLEGEGFPASWYQSANPLAILLFAPVFSWLWLWLNRHRANPSTPMKFAFGLYLLGLAFLAMVAAAFEARGPGLASPHWLLITYVVYTWGELCLSPVGLSMVTKLAPARLQSLMMGVWFLSFALSNLLGGFLAAFSTRMDISRHVVELRAEHSYAEVRFDARRRELSVTILADDQESALPIETPTIAFDAAFREGSGGGDRRELTLSAVPQTGEDEGRSSRFVAAGEMIPDHVDDIEDISGTLRVPIGEERLEANLVHDHYTFVFDGLAGFYLMLVVFPIGTGLVITLLSPLLRRMMHGIQ